MIEKGLEGDCMVGFCHNGSVTSVFMNSLLAGFAEDLRRAQREGRKPRLVEYHDAAGPYIHDNRARITRYFIEYTDYQWLWMLDNDIEFPADSLYQLLEAAEEHDVKILGGAYWNQYEGSGRYLSWLLFAPQGVRALPALPENPDLVGPIEVTAVGMGCTLIHRDVIRDILDLYGGDGDPWDTFSADILVSFEGGGFIAGRSMDELVPAMNGRAIRKIERMGEDVTFCLRAKRAGHSTYGLPSLVVEHYKSHRMAHGREDISAEAAMIQ